MIPVLASPAQTSPHHPSLIHLAGRLCPFLLALAIALLAAGCAPLPSTSVTSPESPGGEPAYKVVLPGQGTSSLKVGLPLGSREIRAGEVSVILEWSTLTTDCAVHLAPRVARREGQGRPTTADEAAGILIPGDASDLLWAGGEPGEIYLKPYILELRKDALRGSGEVLTLEFSRDPEMEGDTCETDLMISAVRFSAGTKLASEAMHIMRDDRPRPGFGVGKVRTATIKPK